MLAAALRYAARGLPILPCNGKVPWTAHGSSDATCDAARIREWWGEFPAANIGLATGTRSRLFVIDLDGEGAAAALSAIGDLPHTLTSITPRPGRHLFFRLPDGVIVRNSAGRLAPGVDARGEGGFVVIAPSVGANGVRYRWENVGSTLANPPQWLLDRLAQIGGNINVHGTPPKEWRALVQGTIAEGTRDSTLTRITGHLLRRYVDPWIVLAAIESLNATHCVPPLPAADIRRIVNSIAGKELRRRG
jgi:hypothetical protein